MSQQGAPVPGQLDPRAEARRVRELVDAHWAFIGRLLRHLGVRTDLDDALQQVFITLVQKLSAVEPGRERAFLAGCAVNVAARHRRQSASVARFAGDSALAEQSDGLDPERLTSQQRELARLDAVLADMADEVRSVFLLYEVEELTMLEIATALDIPQGTVASRLRRARDILRERLSR